jgi:zinc/manganese transport system permease protein
MFAGFMTNTWIAATLVAVVAGAIGFFVVLRGASFLAHAIPHGAFAGAAGAVLIGIDPLLGLGLFAAAAAVGITALGRRARQDVIVALSLVLMLGLGALFLSMSTEYSAEVFALLFGQILGVSTLELLPLLIIGAACLVAVATLYRPLLTSSVLPDMASARGLNSTVMTLCFTLLVAMATTMSVPVVGALLMFSLLVGPPAAARAFVARPATALALSIALSVVAVWVSIAAAYETDLPIGFFVTAVSTVLFIAARMVNSRYHGPQHHQISIETDYPLPKNPDHPAA